MKLYDISHDEFSDKHLLRDNNICADELIEIRSLKARCVSDGEHDFAVYTYTDDSTNITVPYELTPQLLEKVRAYFPESEHYTFFAYEKYSSLGDNITFISYLYRFPVAEANRLRDESPVTLQLITDENSALLEAYCERYQQDFFEKHPARLTNIYKGFQKVTGDIECEILLVLSSGEAIGFLIIDKFRRYGVGAIGQIMIEPEFRGCGNGQRAQTAITKRILAEGLQPYGIGIDYDNLASINCVEKTGYVLASARVSVKGKD